VPLAAFPHPEAPALDRELADGDELPFGGGSLKVVHTPGHTRGHLCFWLAEDRTLFAGDLVAGEGYIVIDPPDGDMSQYLDSLRRARDLDPAVIRPGHGPEIKAPRAYLAKLHRAPSPTTGEGPRRSWPGPADHPPAAASGLRRHS